MGRSVTADVRIGCSFTGKYAEAHTLHYVTEYAYPMRINQRFYSNNCFIRSSTEKSTDYCAVDQTLRSTSDNRKDAASGSRVVPLSVDHDERAASLIDEKTESEQDQAADHSGVFRDNQEDDIAVLVKNFTAPALAEALRSREATLQRAATMLSIGNIDGVKEILFPFLRENVQKRRIREHKINLTNSLTRAEIVILQRYLHRLPRRVFYNSSRRASVVIPLCNVDGKASILFERRSSKVRTYKHQVCFPGGMLEEGVDATIVQTSLRETEEELGIPRERIEVLGVLRCKWDEVASMTGIAVTPVVGFIGELDELQLVPNSDEVEEYFTVTLEQLVDENNWAAHNFASPVYVGSRYKIWGLTGYLLHKFVQNVLSKCTDAQSGHKRPFMPENLGGSSPS